MHGNLKSIFAVFFIYSGFLQPFPFGSKLTSFGPKTLYFEVASIFSFACSDNKSLADCKTAAPVTAEPTAMGRVSDLKRESSLCRDASSRCPRAQGGGNAKRILVPQVASNGKPVPSCCANRTRRVTTSPEFTIIVSFQLALPAEVAYGCV